MENNKPVNKMISQNDGNVIKRVDENGYEYETTSHNIELDISTLFPGTSLTVPAYDKDGNMIKEANKEFTEEDIRDLKSKNIKTIYYTLTSKKKLKTTVKTTFDGNEGALDKDSTYIIGENGLKDALDKVRKVFDEARQDDKVDMSTIYSLVDSFYNAIKEKNSNELLLINNHNIDDYLYSNAINTCPLTLLVAKDFQSVEKDTKNIGIAALLHDIGFVKLPENIVKTSTSQLSKEDALSYMKHPQISGELITKRNKYIGVDPFILKAIEQHHEYFNGTGFPNKISGEQLDPLNSIITLSDLFDYIVRNPNFQENLDYRDSLVYIYDKIEKLFEPRIASIFIRVVSNKLNIKYLFGDDYFLVLNTGEIALIDEENQYNILKPKLRIIADKTGKKYTKMFRIDLKTDLDRKIVMIKKIKKS